MQIFKHFKNDLLAGVVVFLVALPLCLGIALAQKAPLFSGIIAGVIGGIVVASISGSRLSVSGPAAGLTSIVLAGIASLGSFEAFLVSVTLAGVIQIALGFARAGIIGHYIPSSVIKGMLAGIGIILIIKQIPHLVGYDTDPEGDEAFIQADGQNTFSELVNMLNYISFGPVFIGVMSLLTLIFWDTKFMKSRPWAKFVPGPLVVVVMAVITNQVFIGVLPDMQVREEHLVLLPKITSLQDLFGSFTFPDFSKLNTYAVYETAGIIAAVASLETLLNIEAVDKLDPSHNMTPTNRELVAQGVGNVLSGLIGGLPITSVIVRSSANIHAGAKSQLSSIVHGFLFIVTIFLMPGVLMMIPLAALAGILIHTGFKLTSPKIFRSVMRFGKDQFIPFVITIGVFLLTDLLKGVTVGLVAAIIFILRNNFKTPYKLFEEEVDGRKSYFVKFAHQLTFINKGKIAQLLHRIPPGSKIYLDAGNSNFIDKDIIELINEFKRSAKNNQIEVTTEGIMDIQTIS